MLSGLTEKQSRRIDDLLLEMLVRAETEALFLCDRGGYILAEALVEEYKHNENIAALAAGSFYATREIARLVGEPEFRCVFHEGDNKGIYMQNTAADLLLVVVFGRQTNPGLVKLCAEETVRELDAFLKESNEEEMREAIGGLEVDGDTPEQAIFQPIR